MEMPPLALEDEPDDCVQQFNTWVTGLVSFTPRIDLTTDLHTPRQSLGHPHCLFRHHRIAQGPTINRQNTAFR